MGYRIFCLVTLLLLPLCLLGQQKPGDAQQPPATAASAWTPKATFVAAPAAVETLLETKIKAEWEAIKKRDKEAFSRLLTDDFIQVESDGDGARNRFKAANELAASFVSDYHLQLMKTYALASDITYVRYECNMEFPQKSALRFKRMWISEIWVKQGSDWKLWRYQETPVR